jgi:hypothetical protein
LSSLKVSDAASANTPLLQNYICFQLHTCWVRGKCHFIESLVLFADLQKGVHTEFSIRHDPCNHFELSVELPYHPLHPSSKGVQPFSCGQDTAMFEVLPLSPDASTRKATAFGVHTFSCGPCAVLLYVHSDGLNSKRTSSGSVEEHGMLSSFICCWASPSSLCRSKQPDTYFQHFLTDRKSIS